jgi:hypothetical protein
MRLERLRELQERGWTLTRDGSTASALFVWEDPDEPGNGWELHVLHSSGHRPRFTLEPLESGLTERSREEGEALRERLAEALELLRDWRGETGEES